MPINLTRISELLTAGESRTVEFKTAKNNLNKDLFDTVCAFLNRDGGDILLGVKDDGTVQGIDPDAIQKMKQDFANLANDPQTIAPPCYLSIDDVIYEDKTLLHIYVPPGSQVHRCRGKIYDRNEDGDYNITDNQAEVGKLYSRKLDTYTENKIFEYIRLEDLRQDLIERVRLMAKVQRTNHPWVSLTNEELLKSAGLFKKDFVHRIEGFTLASVLLFGTDELILSVLPHHKTDAICRRINTDRYDDRDDIRTNLLDSYDRLIAFGEKHLNDPFYLEGVQRISVRSHILREIIGNLLIHREYSYAYPAKFVIESDRIFTENGNRPHGFGHIDPDHFTPFPKNPTIARVFKEIGLADELGSGVRKLFKYCRAFGGSDPILDEQDCFRFILPVTSEKNFGENEQTSEKDFGENEKTSEKNFGENEQPSVKISENIGENANVKPIISIDVKRLYEAIMKAAQAVEFQQKFGKNIEITFGEKTSEKILALIYDDPKISAKEMAKLIGISVRAVELQLDILKNEHKIVHNGPAKGGHWVII